MSNKRPITPAFPVCRFSFADGRRCALPASPESNGLSYTLAHAVHRPLRPSDLARELTTPYDSPASAPQIHRFLAKLPRALAEGLITRQDVRTYTNLCNLMLQCHRASHHTNARKRTSAKRVHPATPIQTNDHETPDPTTYPPDS